MQKQNVFLGIAVMLSSAVLLLMVLFTQLYCFKISNGPKVVIDHDGGADDAMALFIALLREKYFNGPSVVAITTVHGNVNESQCFVNTQRILNVAGRREVPIYRGSRNALLRDYPSDHFFGTDGLGDNQYDRFSALRAQPDHAVFALIELSKKYKGELIVVALAPLTNIALAIRIDPDFIGRLKHLYVGGGEIHGPSYSKPEFNALLDAEAYYIVAQAATPERVTVIPYSQIKESVPIARDWRTKVLGSIKTKIMKAQNEFEDISLPTSDIWQLLDPAVMAVALQHSIVGCTKLSKNSIILCGDDRGINTNNFSCNEPNVNLIYSASKPLYKKFLLDTFSAELK